MCESVPTGIRLVSKLLDLHDNLLTGVTGRRMNGVGAIAVLALATTGLVVGWPGIDTWRRSLSLHRGAGWKRLTWDLHSMIGFWSLGFTWVFAVSGVYLASPELFQDLPTDSSLSRAQMPGHASATELFIGSPSCISAALTTKAIGPHSDWHRRPCL
jgi:uncharacterized iron-regulated membrane protein